MIESAQQIFSGTMMVLFVLLFVRSGWNVIGSLVHKFDTAGTLRMKLHSFIAAKIPVYTRVCSALSRADAFVSRTFGKGMLPLTYKLLTPTVTILTTFVCIGVIVMTLMSLSLATIMEFYIVYVMLQLPFVLCQVAFAGEPIENVGEVFVDVFWPAHKRTLEYLAALAASIRAPFVSA